MNRIFKVVFNRSLGVWQAVAETARRRGKCTVKTLARFTLTLACALALPAPVTATDLLVGNGGNGGGTGGLGGAGSSTSGGGGGIGRNGGIGIGGGGGGGGIGGGGGGGTYATSIGGGAGGGVAGGGGNGNNISGGSSGGAGGSNSGAGGGSGGAGGAYVLGIAHGSGGGIGSGGGGAGGNGIGGGGGGGGADIIEIGAGGGGGGGAGIGGGGGGGGAGGAGAPGSNGGNGGSADTVINSGPTASLSSNTTHRLVGVGGGGGGGGGGFLGGNGVDGTLTVDNATLTVSQSLLVGGGGGGGGSGSGGNGGSGTLVLTNGAGLSVAQTLLIGGYSGGEGGAGDGGAGGSGTVSSAAGTTISIGNSGRLVLGAHAPGVLNLGGALSFGSPLSFTINSTGTLNFGSGVANTGAITGIIIITHNGAINFNQSNASYTLAAALSGSGSVTHNSGGTTILTGNSSYSGGTTINAGTLQIGNGGTSGSIAGNIVNNGTLTFNRSDALTYAGNVSGTGALTQSGAGTLTLTGSNTYSGVTTVNAGTLAVNSSITSTVAVNSGGALGGSGAVGGVNVFSGGIFAPGNSIGTLAVNGNVSFASGSIYRVEANAAGQADRINATGSATLSGGTVDVQAASGTYQRDTRYTILNATGGVTGSFATATSNLAFLTPSLAYDANNVFLTLTRNDVQFNNVATTPSEQAFATYLDGLGNNPLIMTLLTRLDGLTAEQARQAFTSLGGNALIAGTNMTTAGAAQFMQRVSARMHSPGSGTGLAFSGLRLAALDAVNDAPAVYAQAGVGASRGSAAYGRGFWMQAGGNRGNVNGNGGAPGYDWRGGSLALGADTEMAPGTVLGVAFGYDKTTAYPDAGGSTKVKSPRLSVYGSHETGPWTFSANAGYSRPDFDTQRLVIVGNNVSVASSSHRGDEWSAGVEAQYTLDYGSFKLKPLAGLRYINLKQNGYVETGSIANLAVARQRTESTASLFGARWQRAMNNDKGMFEVRAIWSHEFGNTNPAMSGRLAAVPGGAAFTVNGVPLKRDALTLGLGFATQMSKRLSLHFDVNAEMRGSGQNSEMLMAGLRYAW